LGQKHCRDHHDLFFALRGLLDLGHDQSEVKTILADDTFESYKDLVWRALTKGDYSPLLFLPQDSEPCDERAPWLRGYSRITQKLWDLGVCRRLPKHATIVCDGQLRPKVESVGTIEAFEFLESSQSPEMVFYKVCVLVGTSTRCDGKTFCDTIDRVFPFASSKGIYWAAEPIEREEVEFDRVEPLVERIRHSGKTDGLELCKKLFSILGLGLPEKESHVSRIQAAIDEAAFYGKDREGLARVRCRGCDETFVYRVMAWEDIVTAHAKGRSLELYRIPGLLYDDTVPGGVGILVMSGRIVGRASYATPACDCRVSEVVELQT
jgi:hypothetical protein